jgi:DNA-binding transcriptional LysR family regulator
MTIDTRQLRYFIAVAEETHFGRAAERLRMSQPPLSQQIKQLEVSLGTSLLTRNTRSVDLTPAGSLLLSRGRRVIDELDSIEANVRRVGAGLQGIVRVGFTGTATYGVMPRVVRQASETFAGLAVEVSGEKLTPSLIAGLESNAIDIAVLRPPFASELIDHVIVASERLVAAVPAGSPLARSRELVMADLAAQDFVGYPTNSTVAQAIATSWHLREVQPASVQTASETSTLLSLVAAGIGIALVPESATSLNIGGMNFIPVSDAPNVDLAVAWRRSETSPAVLTFLPFLEALITNAPERDQ